MALSPNQPLNYRAQGFWPVTFGVDYTVNYPDFRVRGAMGASETHPSDTVQAAQLPDCDLTGSSALRPRARTMGGAWGLGISEGILVNCPFFGQDSRNTVKVIVPP